ncbi:MAG: response regulator [Candidatus Hinthialibacter antarcticus]|nr:response regulator [Candidatus Hinthialibacter antarcticus]
MRRTSIKEDINESWLIAPEGENYVITAELRSTTGMNMTFATEDDLIIGCQVLGCPNDIPPGPPEQMQDAIDSHPKKIHGEVIREDGDLVYKIRVGSEDQSQNTQNKNQLNHVFKEAGFRLTVEAHGWMNMTQFIKLINHIKMRAVGALRILLDFSAVEDMPPTAPALIRDLIKHFARNHRITAVVGCEKHCTKMASQLPSSRYIHMFQSSDEAERFFQQDPIRILIVEDDPATQAFIAAFLEERGLKPTCVGSAEEGIESSQAERPDLILMDIHLPGMSGLDAILQIRKDINLCKIAIIILTGGASEGAVLAGRKAGINGYFLKPFHPKKFAETIFKALEDVFEEEDLP